MPDCPRTVRANDVSWPTGAGRLDRNVRTSAGAIRRSGRRKFPKAFSGTLRTFSTTRYVYAPFV